MGQAAERTETTRDGRLLRLHQEVGFNPLDYPICTRAPRRLRVQSSWVGHLPFGMGVVAMTRPRLLVERGTGWGVAYSAFCQAVKELGLETRCLGVDRWDGATHLGAPGPRALDDLRAHHDPAYGLFSELVRGDDAAAAARLDDRSVDLLHLGGLRTHAEAHERFEAWLPKLSERGVVLVHGTEVRDRDGFGVWRFWDEIKGRHPSFEFPHAGGLGVLAVGEATPAGLLPLVGATRAEAATIRAFFANLGERLGLLCDTTMQESNVRALLHAKAEECERWERAMLAQAAECDELRRYYGQRRFRGIDKVAHKLARYPRTYRVLKKAAGTTFKAIRTVRARFRRAG